MNNTFSKEHSQIAKGVAILLMLYHHLFIIPDRISCGYQSLIDMIFPGAQITIATFSKLCVCIYVFLSGYGLYFSLKNETSILKSYKNVLFRAIKFMTTFIIIFFLFVPIGMFTGYFEFNAKYLLGSLFGLCIGTYNNTWWFVNAYITLLFITPLFIYFVSNAKLYKKILVISTLPVLYVFIRIIIHFIGSNIIIDHYFWHLENLPLVLSLFTGIVCAKFNIYKVTITHLQKITNKKTGTIILILVSVLIMILSIILRVKTVRNIVDMRWDFIIAPLFVFSTATLIYNSKFKNVFILLGNHSTNMWLTHAFLCYTYFQMLVFLPYYSELVFLWFILLTLLTSYIVNLISVPINNLLYSKEHRLSYKGYFTFYKK